MGPLPKFVVPLMVLGAIGLTLAAPAGAHTLKPSRAGKANKTFGELVCEATNDPEGKCLASQPGPCQRVSDHRVRCSFSLTIEFSDKSQGRCVYLMEWTIRNRSSRLHPHFLGIRSCTEIKPPEAAPVP